MPPGSVFGGAADFSCRIDGLPGRDMFVESMLCGLQISPRVEVALDLRQANRSSKPAMPYSYGEVVRWFTDPAQRSVEVESWARVLESGFCIRRMEANMCLSM